MEDSQSKYLEKLEQGRYDNIVAQESILVLPTRKDHYRININGVNLGEWELSQIRHFIQVLDKCAN